MVTDLFKSKKDQLLGWIRVKKEVKTHEVMEWGLRNKHIRADRDCRDMAGIGLLERVSYDEKIFRFGKKMREDIWRIV